MNSKVDPWVLSPSPKHFGLRTRTQPSLKNMDSRTQDSDSTTLWKIVQFPDICIIQLCSQVENWNSRVNASSFEQLHMRKCRHMRGLRFWISFITWGDPKFHAIYVAVETKIHVDVRLTMNMWYGFHSSRVTFLKWLWFEINGEMDKNKKMNNKFHKFKKKTP